jgi:hypothetical protein
MSDWWRRQADRLAAEGWGLALTPPPATLDLPEPPPADPFERLMARARDEMRELVAAGEAEFTSDLHPAWAAMIAEDDKE